MAPIQRFVAMRATVSMAVSAAIAEVGEAEACLELLQNSGAQIAAAELPSYGGTPWALRHICARPLIADVRLPSDCRHMLLVKLGDALRAAPLVLALNGGRGRAERINARCLRAGVRQR